MIRRRDGTKIGTAIGFAVMVVAIVGTQFFDWTWANPEGDPLPLAIGGLAAAIAVVLVVWHRRS